MELSRSSKLLSITGNIKTVHDYQSIKAALDDMSSKDKTITINILDSISITSSVIGYLNKLVLKDGIDLRVNIGDEQLLELIDDLNLCDTLKAKKI